MKNLELRMKNAAKGEKFEEAEMWRKKLFALQHIRDVAVISSNQRGHDVENGINIFGRIEGYDISNISGIAAVGAMVVFINDEPKKSEYKRFKIKGVRGINDVAMTGEVLMRRISHSERSEESLHHEKQDEEISRSLRSLEMTKAGKRWALPDLIVIDGGWGQVNVAREVLEGKGLRIPLVGVAKGFDRKQDRPVFDKENPELERVVENYKDLLLRVRDEAHRFAIAYHRKRLRSRLF